MTTYGVAYWGRDHDRAITTFGQLAAQGFTWVAIPISTERMRYDHTGTARIIALARGHGLETRITPWGVGGLFGGEGVPDAGMSAWEAVSWWLGQARGLNADAMYWDEPHGDLGLDAMLTALKEGNSPAPRNYLYLNPDRAWWPGDGVLTGLDGLGVDAYQSAAQGLTNHILAEGYGLPVHVWVKAFGLPWDDTMQPAQAMAMLKRAGVRDIGVWGYPSAGVSILDCENPSGVWGAITDVMEGRLK